MTLLFYPVSEDGKFAKVQMGVRVVTKHCNITNTNRILMLVGECRFFHSNRTK